MTDLLIYANAYSKDCAAQVVSAGERGVLLDRTVFYALGGVQAGDVGSLRTEDGLVAMSRR